MGKQIHTFQDYLSVVEKSGTVCNQSYIIFILLNKLSPSWISFASTLRHKINSLNLMGVYKTIRIKEETKSFLKL